MSDTLDWLPFLLQANDAIFPTGAYAHSFGLEEIVRLRQVRDEATLRIFLIEEILPSLAHFELPYVRLAHEAATLLSVENFITLDRRYHAAKLAKEMREASIHLGTRRMQILLKIKPHPFMKRMEEARISGECHGHHALVFGAQMACEGAPMQAALAGYAYQSLSGYGSASLKLIRIGQEGCQRVLRDCLNKVSDALDKSLRVQEAQAGWFNPLLEIASMRHECANERMFIS